MCLTIFARFAAALLAGIVKTATGKACNECKTFRQLILVCVQILGHKCSFPNSHFIDSGRKKWQKVLRHWRKNKRLPFQKLFILPLSWVTFLVLTVIWIVWTCVCCLFRWFPHDKSAACKKVWYLLLVLCSWFNSLSIQLETPHNN